MADCLLMGPFLIPSVSAPLNLNCEGRADKTIGYFPLIFLFLTTQLQNIIQSRIQHHVIIVDFGKNII